MKLLGETLRLSASDLAGHLACRRKTVLDIEVAHGRLERRDWHDARVEALWERGHEHERAYLDRLREQGVEVLVLEDGASFDDTRRAMVEGAPAIYQPTLTRAGWLGRADILRRVDTVSKLGMWSYEVVDAKLARTTRAGTILQLCLYSDIVSDVQGVAPEWMSVIRPGVDFEPERYRYEDFAAYYRLVKRRLEAFIAETPDDTYPEPVSHCNVCGFWSTCDERRRADDHLSLVAGISRGQRDELDARDVSTLESLARLAVPLDPRPARGAPESYVRVREQARVQLEARRSGDTVFEMLPLDPERGFARLPAPSPGDIFFDFEGDRFFGEEGLEYLFGYVADERYHALWAPSREQERSAFEQFVDWVIERQSVHPHLHIYHFAHYEPTALKRLMGRYGTRQDEVDRLLRGGVFVDLYRVVREALLVGVESYSIKALEPLYGFERETPLDEASRHLQAFEMALEQGASLPEDSKDKVASYNRDDCLSTLALRDWLESLRDPTLARPDPKAAEPSPAITEKQREVEALKSRLLASVPADRLERDPEQQARFVIANLLDFYRREESATAWEYFRLVELSDEELLFERGALSGLEHVTRLDEAKTPVDRYTFPNQEATLRAGKKLKTSNGKGFGDIVAVDYEARTLDVKKQVSKRDVHPSAVFVHESYRHNMQAKSLLALGERIVANGFDGSPACHLLLKRPPRSEGRPEEAVVLPVQGPPGSGKTYSGARMVTELVRAGRRVGVTAMSHKVIGNLLDEVLVAAKEEGARVRCMRLGSGEDEDSEIVRAGSNGEVDEALDAHDVDVVGGTAWLWSREELALAVDVMFVDEASQFSLADVLAVSQAARHIVLLGDPCQLDQPLQASHPEGTDLSALEHVLDGHKTLPEGRGVFLPTTRRLHPSICEFTSDLFYEGRLTSVEGVEQQALVGDVALAGAGLWLAPVDHAGNQNASPEEVARVASIVSTLMDGAVSWCNKHGVTSPLTLADILIIAPYNAQVFDLTQALPEGARVGTVDKFQGQEAPVVLYSMTTSSPELAPRGMEFLYSLHRLNVATSRALAACVVVASPSLFEPLCHSPQQMRLANALCRYREMATTLPES